MAGLRPAIQQPTRRTVPCPARMTAVLVALLVAAAGLAGCTAGAPSSDGAPAAPESPALVAIRATIDAINATAGGPVAAQRAALDSLAADDQSAEQQRCPAAANTLAFEPAYGDLRPAPDGPADTFLLPTYITIYSGDRIVGSDLANLTLRIVDGRARTTALCVA